MKFAKFVVAAAISAAFAAIPASAATMGMADLTVKSLVILNSANQVVTSGITIQNESRTGTATAKFNGVDATGVGSQTEESDLVGGTVDVKYRCGGPSCGPAVIAGGPENNFTTHVGAPNGNYALSDMYLTGNATQNAGAQGLTRADSSVMSAANKATANSTIANAATSLATFTVNTTLTAHFGVFYDSYVAAMVNTMANATGASLATISWSLTLQEVFNNVSTTVLDWNPLDMNEGVTSNNASQNVIFARPNGQAFSQDVVLTAGRTYKLAINQASNSSASERFAVPEPTSMLLMGLGLLALGAASRRRRNK